MYSYPSSRRLRHRPGLSLPTHLSPKLGLSVLKLFGVVTVVLLTLVALGEGPHLWL